MTNKYIDANRCLNCKTVSNDVEFICPKCGCPKMEIVTGWWDENGSPRQFRLSPWQEKQDKEEHIPRGE